MKFIVSTSALLKGLQAISGVINPNSVLPILENYLFQVSNGQLTVTASDLETTMQTTLPVESKEDGVIAVPAKIILDSLKTFPEQPVTFTIDNDKNSVEISSDNGKYKITGESGNDFPNIPEPENVSSIEMSSKVLSNAINKTLFAVGTDEMRPAMSGVYCQLNESNIHFVATDAHKLVKYTRNDVKCSEPTSFILPRKALNLLKTSLATEEESGVKINYNKSNAFFSFSNINLICRLIDERYPDYEAVIPLENPNKMGISREALLNSIQRVAIFSSKTTHQVKLKINGSELHISAEDIDFANEATERLSCNYEGEDMEIGFNGKFMIEMLSHLDTDEVTVEMSEPNRAGIILPNSKSDDEEILMLVMPVMLHSYA
ncbi:MAG: DNA polymerase III subunit beta [Bacteroidia bacterium]|nr:DNA polymerase III subunit beta [Bacteroidia bacterium]